MTLATKMNPPTISFERILNTWRNGIFNSQIHAPEYYPEMSVLNFFGKKVYMVNHPVLAQYVLQKNYTNYLKGGPYRFLAILLGKGLVTNEGENWHKQRTLIQPAFHRESLRHISKVVTDSTNTLLEKWRQQEGTTINFSRDMAGLTIDIVARSLFTADITPEMVQTVWRNINYLNETASKLIQNPLAMPWEFPMPRYVKSRKYSAELDEIIFGIINKRRNEKNKTGNVDLLQLLLDARYEDTGTGMTDTQLRDEVMTIFVAGHETTVNALGWTWYLIKQHKAVEGKLKDESEKFALNRDPLFEDLPGLDYGKHVMNESMRVYPPIAGVARTAIADDMIGNYFIPAGTEIGINIAGIHRHPAFWQNPFEFIPERFEHFDMKGENRFVFMPFGGGPRICIGNNFAMMEMQLINAMLSSRVEMELVSNNIKPVSLVTLKPGDGVMMRLGKVRG